MTGSECDAAIRPFPNDTEVRCEVTENHARIHEGALRDYAYPGSQTAIQWSEDDRRNFHGEWPGLCQHGGWDASTCVLPRGHRGNHAR